MAHVLLSLHCGILCMQRAMNLTEEQERAVKEAHGQFVARQQSLAQHRAQALPYLRAALYTGADSSTQSCLRCAGFVHPESFEHIAGSRG